MTKYLLIGTFLLFSLSLIGGDNIEIQKVLVDEGQSRIHIFLEGDNPLLAEMHSQPDSIDLKIHIGKEVPLAIQGTVYGAVALHDNNVRFQKPQLIVMDQGAVEPEILEAQYNLIESILGNASDEERFCLLKAGEEISAVVPVTKYNFKQKWESLSGEQKDIFTDYQALFWEIGHSAKKYARIFFITNGKGHPELNKIETYQKLVNHGDMLGTQIVPIATPIRNVNQSFIQYLEDLNTMPIPRSSIFEVPIRQIKRQINKSSSNVLDLIVQMRLNEKIVGTNGVLEIGFSSVQDNISKSERVVLTTPYDVVVNQLPGNWTKLKWRIFLLGFLMVAAVYYAIALFNRYVLRRDHVFRYADIKDEALAAVDPLKLSRINLADKVVRFGNKVMLLESWKYLRAIRKEQSVGPEFDIFFNKSIEGNIFQQHHGFFRYLYPVIVALSISVFAALGVFACLYESTWLLWEFQIFGGGSLFSDVPVFPYLLTAFAVLPGPFLLQQIAVERTFPDLYAGLNLLLLMVLGCLGGCFLAKLMNQFTGLLPIWLVFFYGYSALLIQLSLGHLTWDSKTLWHWAVTALGLLLAYYLIPVLVGAKLPAAFIFFVSYLLFMAVQIGLICGDVQTDKLSVQMMSAAESADSFIGPKWDLDFYRKYYIGRSPDSDLFVKWDEEVSDRHARIGFSKNSHWIEALEGPVILNGRPITNREPLDPWDEIQLGRESSFRFQVIAR